MTSWTHGRRTTDLVAEGCELPERSTGGATISKRIVQSPDTSTMSCERALNRRIPFGHSLATPMT
jgi:hypothetical protein